METESDTNPTLDRLMAMCSVERTRRETKRHGLNVQFFDRNDADSNRIVMINRYCPPKIDVRSQEWIDEMPNLVSRAIARKACEAIANSESMPFTVTRALLVDYSREIMKEARKHRREIEGELDACRRSLAMVQTMLKDDDEYDRVLARHYYDIATSAVLIDTELKKALQKHREEIVG